MRRSAPKMANRDLIPAVARARTAATLPSGGVD